MNTSSIASTTHAPQIKIPLSSSQAAHDYAALQNALQAGGMEAACGAYAAFWQDVATQAGPAHLFVPNVQTGHDLQAMGHSLSLANISGARRAFAMFQVNMPRAEPSASRQLPNASPPAVTASVA